MRELIHFSASWCQPCKQMQPVLDKFINDNPDIVYTKYDADKDVSVFQEYKITGVPAFVAIVDGKEVFHKGILTEGKLAILLDK